MKTTDKPIKRIAIAQTPRRKLLATLTAAALLTMAGASHADAAPPIALTFAPLGSQSHPDELAFDIPLASGESVTDIRYLTNGAETSLMSAFELTPGAGGVSARFLPKLDFTAYVGQTLTLTVVKSDSTFAAQREEQLLLKVVSPRDLQQDLKLVAVTDGTPKPMRWNSPSPARSTPPWTTCCWLAPRATLRSKHSSPSAQGAAATPPSVCAMPTWTLSPASRWSCAPSKPSRAAPRRSRKNSRSRRPAPGNSPWTPRLPCPPPATSSPIRSR